MEVCKGMMRRAEQIDLDARNGLDRGRLLGRARVRVLKDIVVMCRVEDGG